MAAPVIAHRNMLFGPVSVCTTYLKIASEVGLSANREEDPHKKIVMLRIARFITIAITIPTFTSLSVFYNVFCFTVKGTFAILTYLFDTDIFHYTHNEYLNQMNLHIAYAIRELANLFFIAFISLGYTFDPLLTGVVDNFITNTIDFICLTEPVAPPHPAP